MFFHQITHVKGFFGALLFQPLHHSDPVFGRLVLADFPFANHALDLDFKTHNGLLDLIQKFCGCVIHRPRRVQPAFLLRGQVFQLLVLNSLFVTF